MNQYSELLQYIYNLAIADPFINTVTQGDTDKIDLDKGNIFSLLHIVIDSGSFSNGSTVLFSVSLDCLALRNINKAEVIIDKFWKQDNEVDNHNETLASLNKLWTTMYKDFEKRNITASENPTLEKISFAGKNLYDGWSLSFEVELPNTTLSLCE